MKATSELETVVTIIAANERQIRRHDPLRKYMDIIVEHLEKVRGGEGGRGGCRFQPKLNRLQGCRMKAGETLSTGHKQGN